MSLAMLAAQPSFAGQAAVRAVVQPQMALSDLKDLAKQQVLAATPSNMPTAPDRARPIHESRGRETIYTYYSAAEAGSAAQ